MKLPEMKLPEMKFSDLSKLAKVADPRRLASVASLPKLSTPSISPAGFSSHRTTSDASNEPRARRSIWRTITKPLRMIPWRMTAVVLCGIGILHIVATLAAPSLALSTAYNRLNGILPTNRTVILPPLTPQAQPLPFMSPALRYAMCRYDTANGPIDVSVELNNTGSSLTIYTANSEAVYTAAQSEVPLHRVRIIPADGRFLGLSPEARGQRSNEVPSATLHSDRGIIVYATPDLGSSYQSATQRQLASVSCKPSGQE